MGSTPLHLLAYNWKDELEGQMLAVAEALVAAVRPAGRCTPAWHPQCACLWLLACCSAGASLLALQHPSPPGELWPVSSS